MLGHKVFQVFQRSGLETHASFLGKREYDNAKPVYEHTPPDQIHIGVNALDTDSIRNLIQQVKPDVTINCIGIIN